MKRFIFNLLYCFAVCVSVSSFAQTSVTVLSPHMPIIKSMIYELEFNTEDFSDDPIHFQPEIIYIDVFLDCER